MGLTKQEFSAAVCLGCLTATELVSALWGLALALVYFERVRPGVGWWLASMVAGAVALAAVRGVREWVRTWQMWRRVDRRVRKERDADLAGRVCRDRVHVGPLSRIAVVDCRGGGEDGNGDASLASRVLEVRGGKNAAAR